MDKDSEHADENRVGLTERLHQRHRLPMRSKGEGGVELRGTFLPRERSRTGLEGSSSHDLGLIEGFHVLGETCRMGGAGRRAPESGKGHGGEISPVDVKGTHMDTSGRIVAGASPRICLPWTSQ